MNIYLTGLWGTMDSRWKYEQLGSGRKVIEPRSTGVRCGSQPGLTIGGQEGKGSQAHKAETGEGKHKSLIGGVSEYGEVYEEVTEGLGGGLKGESDPVWFIHHLECPQWRPVLCPPRNRLVQHWPGGGCRKIISPRGFTRGNKQGIGWWHQAHQDNTV